MNTINQDAMSDPTTKEKEEKLKKKVDWKAQDAFASLEANARIWRETQQSLMMSLQPWLNIQADLARHAETAERMMRLAAQSQDLLRGAAQVQIQEPIAKWVAVAHTIRLPEIPRASLAVDALRKADVDVEELVAVIQKLKRQLKLRDEEIAALEKFIMESRRKRTEYVT